MLESILASNTNFGNNIDAMYVGLPSFDLHFYKVSCKFTVLGEPSLDIMHLNAFMGELNKYIWDNLATKI